MRTIRGLAWGVMLVGCADGGGSDRPVTLEWDRSPYVIEAGERSIGAVVVLGGSAPPPASAVDVRATQGGVVVETLSKPADASGRIAVTMRPRADAQGAYVVTATAVAGGVLYSATTMVVVQD